MKKIFICLCLCAMALFASAQNMGLKEITIPASVKVIYPDAFGGCGNLKRVIVQSETPPAVGGHAWIIDGYKYYEDVITDHNTEPATVTTSYRYYNHVNWGWYGNSDGYYFDGIFDANNAYSYDNPSYGISHYSFTDYLWFAPIEM